MSEGGQESGAPGSEPRRLSRGLRDGLRSLAIALVLFALIRTFVVEAFKIPTSSMENTLLVGDFLLVNKAAYGSHVPGTRFHIAPLKEPAHGDVVVFHPPHEPDKNYVKRVVGVPRDTLEMRDKRLHRNGAPVDEPYARHEDDRGDTVHPDMRWQSGYLIASPAPRADFALAAALSTKSTSAPRYQPTRDNWGPLVVPDGSYFVLGDNRENSEDSRYWGFVAREQIRGEPWLVYYSSDHSTGAPPSWVRRVRWARLGTVIR